VGGGKDNLLLRKQVHLCTISEKGGGTQSFVSRNASRVKKPVTWAGREAQVPGKFPAKGTVHKKEKRGAKGTK